MVSGPKCAASGSKHTKHVTPSMRSEVEGTLPPATASHFRINVAAIKLIVHI